MVYKIGDRVIDAGFKGTVVGVIDSSTTIIQFDKMVLRQRVPNFYLTKINEPRSKKKPRIAYWK